MTLHCHEVNVGTLVEDGKKPVHVPVGWQIAAGDADDARVCGAHPWQSICLVFANGDAYGTAMCDPSFIGRYPQRSCEKSMEYSIFCLTLEIREKSGRQRLLERGYTRGENKV
jgi:hypothetical protein